MIIARETVIGKVYEDNNIPNGNYDLILYKNDKEKDFYAFGVDADLRSFYGFPVNQCGTLEEVKEELKRWSISDFTSKTEKNACRRFLDLLSA